MPQIKKPSKRQLKKDGFKLVLDRKKSDSKVFVQKVDKDWFNDHADQYITFKKTIKIYENETHKIIFMEV